MKCIRLHLLLLILLLISVSAFAGPRSFRQAKQIAERQAALLGIVMDESAASQAKSFGFGEKTQKSQASDQETASYYVFPHGEGKGFTIVSGDDCLPEIVGYTDQGTYDEASLPESYKNFMKAYQEMVEAVTKGDQATLRNLAEVKAYRSSVNTTHSKAVSPLLGNIAWNQSKPFNNMCPIYDGKNRAVTGCVATAMAQVMAYYKHPKQLLQDIPEYTKKWYGRDVAVPGISKSDGVYDWDNMLPFYSSAEGSYSETQANAVAKLMFHCGAAVQMGYGEQSGANVTPSPLAKYFGYDADMMVDLTRATFTLAEWIEIIDKELVAKRPILYSGMSSDGGHEFVCDGSDGNGLYHINWGWGGSSNGYFDITILNPAKGGIGSGNAPDGFNRSCSMIVGIAPDNGKTDGPVVDLTPVVMVYIENDSYIELVKSVRSNASEKFSVSITNHFCNQSSKDFKGYLAYGVKKDDGNYEAISSKYSLSLLGVKANGSTDWLWPTIKFDYAFPIGKTTIFAIYSEDGKKWKPCAYHGMDPFVVEATAMSLSVSTNLLSISMKEQDELFEGMENDFELSISNSSNMEYLGELNIYSSAIPTQPSSVSESLYVTVPACGNINRIFSITPTVGDLFIWVTDKNGKVLVDCQKFTVGQSSAPILSVVKAWSNATPGVYEEENAIYWNYKVKVPKVNDDKVVFNYEVKNDGGTAVVRCFIIGENCETMTYSPIYENVRLPGNGKITTLSREYTPENIGSRTIYSDLYFRDANGEINYSTSLPSYRLMLSSGTSGIKMKGTELVAYVAGKAPTGVSSVASSSSYVYGGNGEIVILSDVSKHLNVYNLNGQKVTDVNLTAGELQRISIATGIYVVGGKKIVVK